jgi:hypothetical protein
LQCKAHKGKHQAWYFFHKKLVLKHLQIKRAANQKPWLGWSTRKNRLTIRFDGRSLLRNARPNRSASLR